MILRYWYGFRAIVWREIAKFLRQTERLLSALVRPMLWLIVFAAGRSSAQTISLPSIGS